MNLSDSIAAVYSYMYDTLVVSLLVIIIYLPYM